MEIFNSTDCRKRREKTWCGIIIHHTGQSKPEDKHAFENIIHWLTNKDKYYVSAHYVIGWEGETAQLVDPEKYEAFHAGRSRYWHPYKRSMCDDWNRYSIGIELVGDGNNKAFSSKQYRSLKVLIKRLRNKFPEIHPLAIVGHENISPDRKVDPGKYFDWDRLFKSIYES